MVANSSARNKLKQVLKKESNNSELPIGVLSSKQESEEGMFSSALLRKNELLKPPYDPYKLTSIVENSQVLPQCIDTMCKNIHGFGYEFDYNGDEEEASLSDEVMQEYENLTNFFKQVNEEQSFVILCMEIRRDLEITGNAYMEVIRDNSGGVALIYRADSKRVRLQRMQAEPIEIKVPMWRNGKLRDINIYKKFRKFAMLNGKDGQRTNLTWFKQYGDPRPMCKISGKFDYELGDGETIIEEASEIIHFKIGNGTYGIPRWSGQILISMGMQSAEYVNYDLFDNQVVPPLAILVSGGALTEESIEDITEVLVKKRGIENFNKVLILESQSDGTLTERDSSKIELKELSAARKEDGMFTTYTEKGEGKIRTSFRLCPMVVGRAESYSKSSADSSKRVGEEQVFAPERLMFDSIINSSLMRDLQVKHWVFKSNSPRLIDGDNMAEIFNAFSRNGAFTINQAIRLANRLLSMDMTEYANSDWANVPYAIVEQYAKLGLLEIQELNITSSVLDGLKDTIDDPKESKKPKDDKAEDKKIEELKKVHASFMQLSRKFAKLNEQDKSELECVK